MLELMHAEARLLDFPLPRTPEQPVIEVKNFKVQYPQVATCKRCGTRVRIDLAGGIGKVQQHATNSGHGQDGWKAEIVPPWDPRAKETTLAMPGDYRLTTDKVAHAVIADPNKVRR